MYFRISKFFLYLPVLGIVIVSASTLFPFIVGKYVWFRTTIDLALIFFLLGLLLAENAQDISKRFFSVLKNPLVIAVSIFTVIFLLACFFGFDPKMSFWSNFERGEGGLQILHFYVFFLLLITLFDKEKDWQTIFILAMIGGLGMAVYGLLAGFGVNGFIGAKFSEGSFRFQGSIGNPAYVAAYAIYMIFYALYLLVSKYKKNLRSIGAVSLSLLVIIFLAVFFAAATRGAFLGLVASIIAFVVYFIFSAKRGRKWFMSAAILMLIAVSTMIYFKDSKFVKSLPGSRIFDISFTTKTFADRAIMWKVAIDGWKERPILGWGPENYIQVFDRHFNIKYFKPAEGFGAWFDRAHSIYFDYLVETGILGLLSYLAIFAVFYWQVIKMRFSADKNTNRPELNRDNKKQAPATGHWSLIANALVFALPVAYLVQGIVLFDVFPIYINNFLFLAFAAYYLNFKNK
jgi:O-antigen ligase